MSYNLLLIGKLKLYLTVSIVIVDIRYYRTLPYYSNKIISNQIKIH